MSDTGWVSPGTMADDDTVGTRAWDDPDNAKVSDGSYATLGYETYVSHYLKATNFGFSIPVGATINGIEVGIEKRHAYVDTITDEYVKIIKSNGDIGSENKADTSTSWTGDADVYINYGDSTDLWSETWAYTDINDLDFGVVLSADVVSSIAWVDHIRIKVYYTEGGATSAPFPMFFRP